MEKKKFLGHGRYHGFHLIFFDFQCIGGTIVLFDRKMLRNFRRDGYNWKKKKDGKTVKEAHEHLKVRFNRL